MKNIIKGIKSKKVGAIIIKGLLIAGGLAVVAALTDHKEEETVVEAIDVDVIEEDASEVEETENN